MKYRNLSRKYDGEKNKRIYNYMSYTYTNVYVWVAGNERLVCFSD